MYFSEWLNYCITSYDLIANHYSRSLRCTCRVSPRSAIATNRYAERNHFNRSTSRREEGILSEVTAVALKRVLAWQITQEMNKRGMSKTQMAEAMSTSRSSLDRLLNPNNTSVTLKTINRAASILGKRLQIELVDA